MSVWDITDHGFLSTIDPLTTKNEKYIPVVVRLENIFSSLSSWIDERCLREELIFNLREIASLIDVDFLLNQDESNTERLMHLYSFFSYLYVFTKEETKADRVPSEIAVPFSMIAEKLNRKPILSYSSYCLSNWEKIDYEDEIKPGNIRLIVDPFYDSLLYKGAEIEQPLTSEHVLSFVDMENCASTGISACVQLLQNPWKKNDETHNFFLVNDILTKIFVSLSKMNKAIFDLPKKINFSYTRKDVVCQGCFDKQSFFPTTNKSVLSAEIPLKSSSVLPTFLTALEISENSLIHFEINHRHTFYIPDTHRKLISNLLLQIKNDSLEDLTLRSIAMKDSNLREVYNECFEQIEAFSKKTLDWN